MAKDLLTEGLEKLGIEEDIIQKVVIQLNAYISELELFNSAYDLVGSDTHDDIIVRHILDSLSPWKNILSLAHKIIDEKGINKLKISDIGSGGGLPGIPLSILFQHICPEAEFTLVERMSRRCAFLENCIAVLQLKNVQVLNLELERVEEGFTDIAVFRAFRPLEKKMAKSLLRIVKNAGALAAYKAKAEKITEEMAAIKSIIPEYKVEELHVPFLEQNERNLVIVLKQE